MRPNRSSFLAASPFSTIGLNLLHGVFGFGLSMLLHLVGFVLWILLMVKAFQHELYRLPIAADIADGFTK
jgi:uncharacterized membrane protein